MCSRWTGQRGGMTKTKSMTKNHWDYKNNKARKGFLGWAYSITLPWRHIARNEHFGHHLRTYLCTYRCTYRYRETTDNQNPSNLGNLRSHYATFFYLARFYCYPISSEQLVYGFEREKLLRSSRDAEKQSNVPCSKRTWTSQKRIFESEFSPPRQSRDIKLIIIQRSIEWWQFQEQKSVSENRNGERTTAGPWNKDLPSPRKRTIRNQYATSTPFQRHQTNPNRSLHQISPVAVTETDWK